MNLTSILRKSTSELKKAGIPTANLDVRVLLEDVLKKDSSYFFTHPKMPLTNSQYAKFRSLIRRRKKGEPVAYLVGHKEFYGYDFFVNKNVLIPRPETEWLIDQALDFIKKINTIIRRSIIVNQKPTRRRELKIIDIGTGSGCIIISLALEANKSRCGVADRDPDKPALSGLKSYKLQAKFFASDISKKALYVARKNAKLHNVNKDIRFYHSNLFSNKKMPIKYDIVIANLPYLKSNYKNLDYEPDIALDGGKDGFLIIKRFINQLPEHLNEGGIALLEINDYHGKLIEKECSKIKTLKSKKIATNDGWNGYYTLTKC